MVTYISCLALFLSSCTLACAEHVIGREDCEATADLDLSQLDATEIQAVRVKGIRAKVKRVKLPRGSKPRVIVKTNCPEDSLPSVSMLGKSLVVEASTCGRNVSWVPSSVENVTMVTTTNSADAISGARRQWEVESLSIWAWWALSVAPLMLHRTVGAVPGALFLATGMWVSASAESAPTCEDEVEIEIGVPDDSPDLSTSSSRTEFLEALKQASESFPSTADSTLGGAEGYSIDPDNFRLYTNGGHRRPTDPANAQEIIAAQGLLFGQEGSVKSLEIAKALASQPKGWAAASSALSDIGGVDPAAIQGVSQVAPQTGDPTNDQAQQAFLEHAKAKGFEAAFAWLRLPEQESLRRNLRWWNVNQIATATPNREHVIAVENAIEAGQTDYAMQRIIFVHITGGLTAFTDNDTKVWGADLHVAVDVTHINDPHVVPDRIEVYSQLQRDLRIPSVSTIDELDKLYLMTAAMALYGNNHAGLPRKLDIFYNGDPKNTGGTYKSGSKTFARPFEWLDGKSARSIGQAPDEYTWNAQLNELSPSTVPYDGHQMMSGVFMFPVPLTMIWGVARDGSVVAPDPHNTLPGSKVGALCFFGRGLTFTELEANAFRAAINTSNPSNSDFTSIATIVSVAIAKAWGNDEASPASSFRPGVLAQRSDGVDVPAVVLKHSYDVPSYVNHATSKALDGKLFMDPNAKHRDARDNLDHMAPPEDKAGAPIYKPNGKPRSVVYPGGQSFTIDGYGVTYTAAVTWKFLISLDYDAGMTMYHIRVVMPPSRAHPKGKEVPYLYRAYSPNFGTDYSRSSLGNPYSYNFFESHYTDMGSVHKPSTCSGTTLPLWRSKSGAYFKPSANYFSTYGEVPPVMDPFSAQLGHQAPMQAFPYQHFMVDKGLFTQAICLQEAGMGHSMWHMYSAQHLRGLMVTSSTVSDAYNVLMRYTFQSDGKLKVGSSAHGKPAVGQHGVPGVGGQHASGGKGGYSENHLHWFVIALEPQIELDKPGVVNKLLVSDLVPPDEEPADWFGTAFHRRATQVYNSTETSKMRYDSLRQRRWRLAALNSSTGEELGGLRVSSNQFGYYVQPGNRDVGFKPEDTYAGSHWWLRQDLYVVNATGRRDSTVLLASSTKPGYDPHKATAHPLKDSPNYDRPVVFCMVKLAHEVIAEELPVQSGFSHLEVTVEPQNLLGFNPLILVRQDPKWNEFMENTWMQSYTAPYSSEYGESA